MTVHRQHGDLFVALTTNGGKITGAAMTQDDPNDTFENTLLLTPDQLYALVDDVAVADPDEFARRFPQAHVAELALRRVAVYFKERAEANRQHRFRHTADTFDLAVTRVMEEIEALYPDKSSEVTDPTQALNNYHARS